MELTRRTALKGAGAVGLAALFSHAFHEAALAAPDMDEAEFEQLRQRWVDQLTGRLEVDSNDSAFGPALTALDQEVRNAIELIAPEVDDGPGSEYDLLTNPTFSDVGADGFPAGWNAWNPAGSASATVELDGGPDDGAALAITSDSGADARLAFTQRLPIPPGIPREFTVTAQVKGTDLSGGFSMLRVQAYDSDGSVVVPIGSGPYLRGTFDWQRYERRIELPPEAVELSVGVMLDRTEGTIWFADIQVSDGADARTFVDLPFLPEGNEGNIVTTFRRIQSIATAWATPGSDYFEDESALETALGALRRTNVLTYNPSTAEYGNWWAWESGSARSLADSMALLADHIEPEHFEDYADAIDFYVSDPWYQFPEHSPRRALSEGANRVDLCQAVIIRSIAGADTDRLAHAVAGLSDVWQIVESGNGFYYDGSFIQHSTVPYTGTYGLVLLRALSRLFALLADTSHDIDDPSHQILLDSVEGSFAPVIYRAQMMDPVRGRAISREHERSIDNGFMAIEAIATLAQSVEAATARQWRGRCLHWLETNDYRSIYDGASVPQVAIIKELEASGAEPVPDPLGPTLFARMDRLIYRGEDWATAIAMCSDRIAWYECGNGENEFGFKTSNGMTYLYLPDDIAHYDDEYWPTSDLMAPAGTTVDTTELPARTEGQWGLSTPDNEWTGGAALNDIALAGQHLIGPGGTGLNARKTWLCLPDMIIALGSDVVTGSGNEVKTVIEHRNLGEDHRRLVVDGVEVTAATEVGDPTWAHVEGVAGYLLLDVPQLRASVRERSGSWSRNHTAGSSTEHTRVYATLESVHAPDRTTYAYAVLPGVSANRTQARSHNPGIELLANDADVQAVRIGHVQAANFWGPGRGGEISCDQPASVLAEINPGRGRVSISDPTHQADTVEVFLHGNQPRRLAGQSERVQLHPEDSGLRIVVDTAGLGGVPVTFELRR
ncbi:polysaccharide lyase 8 family protein [Pseudactinotalea sp. Z1739]|uniref:polysaccharide lyase 8 family protein n=1 Tax=Pseudactinotalea sp. Z1739 TaxID=3413028 RepID=UPI003C797682